MIADKVYQMLKITKLAHRNKVHSKTIKMMYDKSIKKVCEDRKFKKTQVQKTKDMKTVRAIILVTTAKSAAQKYTNSTRHVKVTIENRLSKWVYPHNSSNITLIQSK